MNKTLLLLALALGLIGCGKPTPELTEARCHELVQAIPEHGQLHSPETTLSSEYYATWQEAWNMPDGGLGEIGYNEFLYYFVCGNDPCPTHSASIQSIEKEKESALVQFYINHINVNDDNQLHTFHLIVENGRWVIADYDNTLSEMKEYIKEMRIYLQSDEYINRANEILNDPSADEDGKEAS